MPDRDEAQGLKGTEDLLRSLRPAGGVDAGRVLYLAGRAAGARRAAVAAGLGVLLGALAAYPVLRLTVPPEKEVVYVTVEKAAPAPVEQQPEAPELALPPEPAPPEPSPGAREFPEIARLLPALPEPRGAYLKLRQQVLRWGADSLPPLSPPVASGGRIEGPGPMYTDHTDGGQKF